jgi:hypothetical protein
LLLVPINFFVSVDERASVNIEKSTPAFVEKVSGDMFSSQKVIISLSMKFIKIDKAHTHHELKKKKSPEKSKKEANLHRKKKLIKTQ